MTKYYITAQAVLLPPTSAQMPYRVCIVTTQVYLSTCRSFPFIHSFLTCSWIKNWPITLCYVHYQTCKILAGSLVPASPRARPQSHLIYLNDQLLLFVVNQPQCVTKAHMIFIFSGQQLQNYWRYQMQMEAKTVVFFWRKLALVAYL